MKMKKIMTLMLAVILCVGLVACGGGGNDDQAAETPKAPLDLTGTWAPADKGDSYQEAVIKDGTIEINWVSDGGDTKSLYWAGTYVAPTDPTDEYSWTSENDKEKTGGALMASGDGTKEFKYKDGVLSYEASAMGTTKTVKLEKK